MSINLRHYRAFTVVAHTGSFAKSAHLLNISPSALSQLVKGFEHQFDVTLFDRVHGNVTLTDVGQRLLPHATKVLVEHDEAVRAATVANEGQRRLVRLAASTALSCTCVPKLMNEVTRRFPDVEVQLLEVEEGTVQNLVLSGLVDFAIGPDRLHGREIRAIRLFSSPIGLIVASGSRLAARPHIEWVEVDKLDLIFADSPTTPGLSADLGYSYSFKAKVQVAHITTALAMIENSELSFVHSAFIRPLMRAYDLRFVPIVKPEVRRDVVCYVQSSGGLRSHCEDALNVLRDFAATLYPPE